MAKLIPFCNTFLIVIDVMSAGEIVGIIFGVIVAVALILILSLIIFRERKRLFNSEERKPIVFDMEETNAKDAHFK